MEYAAAKYLWALRQVNLALIEGLELAIHVLENEEELSPARRESSIESLKRLIAQSEEIYETVPPKH